MIACDLKQGTENDKVYLDEVDTHIKRGELFLTDLGYFKTEFLQNLDATNRFFISRLKTNTLFYRLIDQGAYDQVSFNKYVEPTADTFDQYLYVGRKKFYARVTGIKVPEEVYKERLIGTLLTNALYTTLNRTLFKTKGIEVSSQKFYKIIKGKLYKLYTFLGDSILKINSISEELLRIAEKVAFPKRERKITIQQLRLELLSGEFVSCSCDNSLPYDIPTII